MKAASTAAVRIPRWKEEAALIAERFSEIGDRGLPLYLQLHAAIAELIDAGDLESGLQMPPEQQLAAILGVSLGTVQKGLQSLNLKGLIVREHGRGTFVAAPRRSLTELRHFRFVDPQSNSLLPVYTKLLAREVVAGDGESVRRLGVDADGFLCVTRLIDVDGKFSCHSEIVLPMARFGSLLAVPEKELESLNLKQIFADRLGIVTWKIHQTVRLHRISTKFCGLLEVAPDTAGMLLEATGYTRDDTAISYQRILIPPSGYPLDVSSELDQSWNR